MNIMYRCVGRTFFASALLAALSAGTANGQVLYSQNFDTDDTANWTINPGNPDVANPTGPPTTTDTDVFFDYSTVGIPTAPNSTGGSTRGLKLQANIPTEENPAPPYQGIFGGYSVSPTGETFTGDYTLTFDWWSNYLGADSVTAPPGGITAGATGSSMLSTFGIRTLETFSNSPGFSNGVYFAATGDGGSTSDYRAYSSERASSYQLQLPPTDPNHNPLDLHATYHAGSRNSTAALYGTAFPGGATVPAGQTTLFPETQFGATAVGAAGFTWNAVEIKTVGGIVTWTVNGTTLITVDTNNFATPTGGNNILFGHSDINAGISLDPYYPLVQFTLIDNVTVTALAAPADADFDGDGDIDGDDFLTWQQGLGISDGSADLEDGDANGDGNVTGADLAIWQGQFATSVAAGGAVPEPATGCIAAIALLALARVRPRRS
jgi:hypothetical protein